MTELHELLIEMKEAGTIEHAEKIREEIDRRLKVLDFIIERINETGSCNKLDLALKENNSEG